MAKVAMVQRDIKRKKMAASQAPKREALQKIARDRNGSPEEIFKANMKLAKLPRNGAKNRQRNRCALTGRPRGYHRKFDLCRIELRDKAAHGQLPGVTKSSW